MDPRGVRCKMWPDLVMAKTCCSQIPEAFGAPVSASYSIQVPEAMSCKDKKQWQGSESEMKGRSIKNQMMWNSDCLSG